VQHQQQEPIVLDGDDEEDDETGQTEVWDLAGSMPEKSVNALSSMHTQGGAGSSSRKRLPSSGGKESGLCWTCFRPLDTPFKPSILYEQLPAFILT